MNKIELKAKLELFQREVRDLSRIKTECRTCEHGIRNEKCDLYKIAVPTEVQAVGCDSWVYDSIPF